MPDRREIGTRWHFVEQAATRTFFQPEPPAVTEGESMKVEPVTKHEYSPDYMAMGDCRICGHVREAAHHCHTEPEQITGEQMDAIEAAALAGKPLVIADEVDPTLAQEAALRAAGIAT